jgi:hypothetical protein
MKVKPNWISRCSLICCRWAWFFTAKNNFEMISNKFLIILHDGRTRKQEPRTHSDTVTCRSSQTLLGSFSLNHRPCQKTKHKDQKCFLSWYFLFVGAWQEWQKYQKYCPTIIYALGFITLTLPLQKLSALIIHHWMIRKEIMWGRNPFNEHWNTKISKQKNGSHILIRVRHMLTFQIYRRLSFESLKKKDWPGFVA